jgi:nicotinamide-nucleotide amidase
MGFSLTRASILQEMTMRDRKNPHAEVVAIGSELLLGQVVDTNSAHLGRELADVGIHLSHITAVRDDLDHIVEVLRTGLDRSDILITTGGLGPTEDDLTREAVAFATGRKLVFRLELMKQIEAIFKARGFHMTPNNRKQAYIPRGALAIENPMGTAPGFILESGGGVVISLPGVPHELEYLLGRAVIPYLKKRHRLGRQVILTRVLRVCGLGESGVDEQIGDLIRNSRNPTIGLLASPGDIKICMICRGKNRKEAREVIHPIEKEIRNRLGTLIYGVDNETLEEKVAGYLKKLNLRLALVDAFTRGIVCQRISRTGSPLFVQVFVLPSRKSEKSFLRLSHRAFAVLAENQENYTFALATRVLEQADVSLAVTGDFKTSNRELRGTVSVAIAQNSNEESKSWRIGGTRDGVAERASIMALDTLRKFLVKKASSEK